MYNNLPQQNYYQPYGQTNYQYPRYPQAEMPQMPTIIKGRPVLSLDEARAAQIDFDGSVHVFTDIGNKKIYTKQFNPDGTATLKTYVLMEDELPNSFPSNNEYITRPEFEKTMAEIRDMVTAASYKASTPAPAAIF